MTTKLSVFNPYDIDDQAFLLASHLPIGRVWQQGFSADSNIGKFLRGLAYEYYRFQVLARKVSIEMDIREANELLIEWEKSVGLPDSCFSTQISDDERRKQIEAKFSKFGGVQTREDFIRVAALFGYSIEIFSGMEVGAFPLTFPIFFFTSSTDAGHTIIIVLLGSYSGSDYFALPFPIPFGIGGSSFLQCIFRKLAPANCQILVINEGDL